jgi:hypothetical protein
VYSLGIRDASRLQQGLSPLVTGVNFQKDFISQMDLDEPMPDHDVAKMVCFLESADLSKTQRRVNEQMASGL